jgi:AraC-like DNA-binding protein
MKSSTTKETIKRLQLAREYIDKYFLEIGEVKEIAEYCAMSEYHFYRCFKEAYQQTPNQYLTQKKLHMAKELLQQTSHSVSQIALMCSYPDVFTFSKAFKRFFGYPPSSLR